MTDSTTPKQHIPPPEGEEWRAMDGAPEVYDPAHSTDVLKEADNRIEKHRKGDAVLRFVDQQGNPLKGVNIQVEQQRLAFPVGDQVWPLDALIRDGRGDGEKARAWKHCFREVFNAANNLCYWTERPRNDASKIEDQQGEWRLENFAETVAWTRAEGMTAKGHPLFWSIQKCVPEWVKRYDYETRMKFAEVRVRNIVSRFKGKVMLWDAVNEPMWEPSFRNLPNRQWPHIEPIPEIVEYIEQVLRWCREENPDAAYLVNDYGMEMDKGDNGLVGNDGSKVTAASQRARFCQLITALQEAGMPPDAIGLQSHTGWVANHADQWKIYDQFAETGLPVHITEFWASTTELKETGKYSENAINELQAEYIYNYLKCAFAHPAMEGFFFWGFMGTAIDWRDAFSGHELKPTYLRVQELLHSEWKTRTTLTTDDEGTVRFRGFYGDYHARLELPGKALHGIPFAVSRQFDGVLTLQVRHQLA